LVTSTAHPRAGKRVQRSREHFGDAWSAGELARGNARIRRVAPPNYLPLYVRGEPIPAQMSQPRTQAGSPVVMS